MYWEEVALGYDSYSLLKTGKDHRGNPWPIVYLESYMDYKPPLYAYIAIPSIWLFGLNEFGVRFPSAFFGTLTVLVIYFLTKELFENFTSKRSKLGLTTSEVLAAIASFLLAISPWHLQFSRAAFEANLALFLITTGIWLFLKSFRKGIFLPISAVFFALSLYSYHGARVFVPLLLSILTFIFGKKLWKMKSMAVSFLIIILSLSFPLIGRLKTKEVRQRFQETSAFTTLDPILESNRKIEEDGGGRIAKLVHHRFWEYGRIFLDKYFQHFNGEYLFLIGDTNPRHSTGEFGLFYHWELLSLLLGMIVLLKSPKKENLLVLGWVLIGPVSGALTKATPHALRTLFSLPAYTIISATGLVQLIKLFKDKKILLFSLYSLLFIELVFYLHFYHHHYPKIYSSHWQYGYKQAINFLKKNQDEYEAVYLTNQQGRAHMYYLFYAQMDPLTAQQLIKPFKNLADIPQIGKVFIGRKPDQKGKILWLTTPGERREGELITDINFLDDQRAFEIWQTK